MRNPTAIDTKIRVRCFLRSWDIIEKYLVYILLVSCCCASTKEVHVIDGCTNGYSASQLYIRLPRWFVMNCRCVRLDLTDLCLIECVCSIVCTENSSVASTPLLLKWCKVLLGLFRQSGLSPSYVYVTENLTKIKN